MKIPFIRFVINFRYKITITNYENTNDRKSDSFIPIVSRIIAHIHVHELMDDLNGISCIACNKIRNKF